MFAPCMLRALLLLLFLQQAALSTAQEIEPRSYVNTPAGINFLVAGFAFMTGEVNSDPAQALEDARIDSLNPVIAYARSLAFGEYSGKFDVVMPWGCLDGSAERYGLQYERDTCGAGDASMKVSVNLYGAPAMGLSESAGWKQDLIAGIGVRIVAPTGSNDPEKLLNVGANRWAVRPEFGVSKARGRFTLEMIGAAAFFGDNDDYFGHRQLEQDPVYSLQTHLLYQLGRGAWISLGATGYRGGRTTIDGVRGDDLQENTRFGASLALPLSPRQSLKLAASTGTSTRRGGDFDAIAVAWQYRWGGGL